MSEQFTQFRLPDGSTTTSPVVYGRAWRSVAAPIERLTNSKVFGFDPDYAFYRMVPANTPSGNRMVAWKIDATEAVLISKALLELEGFKNKG